MQFRHKQYFYTQSVISLKLGISWHDVQCVFKKIICNGIIYLAWQSQTHCQCRKSIQKMERNHSCAPLHRALTTTSLKKSIGTSCKKPAEQFMKTAQRNKKASLLQTHICSCIWDKLWSLSTFLNLSNYLTDVIIVAVAWSGPKEWKVKLGKTAVTFLAGGNLKK